MADEPPPQVTTKWDNTLTMGVAQKLNDGKVGAGYGYPGGAAAVAAYDRGAFTPLRLDWLSELAVDYGALGLKTSAAARFERSLASDSESLGCHQPSANIFDLPRELCPGTHLEGEIREAYVHGSASLGEDQTLTVRLGRQTLIWGESLYFPTNGIASGLAPIDTSMVEKLSGYSGEATFLPVGQISATWQPAGNWTVEAYYQFEWRPSRIGTVGDTLSASTAGLSPLPGGPDIFLRGGRDTPSSTDQYGLALKWHHGETDYGLYTMRFDAKVPILQLHSGSGPTGTYDEDFPRGIEIYGVSLAGTIGSASYGAEVSARRHMPLVTGPLVDAGNAGEADYPRGDTLHAQFSWNYVTPPLPWIPDGAKWTGELAANTLLQATENPGGRNLDRTKSAAALRVVFEPQFLGVLPRLNVSLPIGFGVNLFGLSPVDPQMNRGTGDISIGLIAKYREVWTAALNLTHYFGTAKNVFPYTFVPAGHPLDDADFVALSIQRSF